MGIPCPTTNGSSYSFAWEKGRQLSQAVKGSSTTEFIYDAEGRRIGKIGAGGMTTTYVWEGELLIAEYREGYDETVYLYLLRRLGTSFEHRVQRKQPVVVALYGLVHIKVKIWLEKNGWKSN